MAPTLRDQFARGISATGVSRARIAERLGLPRSSITIMLGEDRDPQLSTVQRIAEASDRDAFIVLVPKGSRRCVIVGGESGGQDG